MASSFDPVSAGISAGTDIIGGLIGGLFGDDEPEQGYNKEYGTEGRRLNFGSRVGQRIAMGDPSASAYFQSRLKTDPELVQRFIDDFGADFRTYPDQQYPAQSSETGMFGNAVSSDPRSRMAPGMFGGIADQANVQNQTNFAQNASNTQDVLNKTLDRLSHTGAGTETKNFGYSGFGDTQPSSVGGFKRQVDLKPVVSVMKTRDAGSGNKYAKLNQERKTGMF